MNFQFSNFNDFLTMNGHGSFVWACYGITFLCIIFGIWYAKNERKKFIKTAKLQQIRQANKSEKQP